MGLSIPLSPPDRNPGCYGRCRGRRACGRTASASIAIIIGEGDGRNADGGGGGDGLGGVIAGDGYLLARLGLSPPLQGTYARLPQAPMLQECSKGAPRVLQECSKSAPRVLQECSPLDLPTNLSVYQWVYQWGFGTCQTCPLGVPVVWRPR